MYGFGRSEKLLSEALGGRLQDVTVTTKYGMSPPRRSGWIAPVHRLARSALASFPALRQRLREAAVPVAEQLPMLTGAELAKSLEASLRGLGVGTIDLLLLHEAYPERIAKDDLLTALVRSREAGKIRSFGVGSRSERVAACVRETPEFCDVVQFEWSVFANPAAELERRDRILHGSLGSPRAGFVEWLARDAGRLDRWSCETGADLREPGMLNRLLLKASLVHNQGHIVLFSTRTASNIRENVRTAEDPRLEAPAKVLHRLVRLEYVGRAS
jgi:D-threo-aldose 1-dehydrogenase